MKSGAKQTNVPGYVYRSSFGQVRCNPVPREFSVALKYRTAHSLGGTTGALSVNSYGLMEFLGNIPAYAGTYYNLYKFCKVVGVDVSFKIVNTTSTPLQFSTGVVPSNEVAFLTIDEAAEIPNSQTKLVSSTGGMDKATFSRFYIPMEMYGNLVTDRFWINGTQASSTTPLETTEPVIYFIGAPVTSSVTWTAALIADITYHVQFFDLNGPV
jgi:hypothetical protein